MRRVMRELAELKKNPPEGIRIQTNEQDMMDVTGIIQGPGEHIPRFKSAIPITDSFSAVSRGYALRWRLLQGQVQVYRRVPRCAS
jgi:hypothetical protein